MSCVAGRQLDAATDLSTDAGGELLHGALHGVGAEHALGDGRRQRARRVGVDDALDQAAPARLVLDRLDGHIDLTRNDLVEAAAPPFVGNDAARVEPREALLQRVGGDRLDGATEGSLVLRPAGLQIGPR